MLNITLLAGKVYLIRVLYANAQGRGWFDFCIMGPSHDI